MSHFAPKIGHIVPNHTRLTMIQYLPKHESAGGPGFAHTAHVGSHLRRRRGGVCVCVAVPPRLGHQSQAPVSRRQPPGASHRSPFRSHQSTESTTPVQNHPRRPVQNHPRRPLQNHPRRYRITHTGVPNRTESAAVGQRLKQLFKHNSYSTLIYVKSAMKNASFVVTH